MARASANSENPVYLPIPEDLKLLLDAVPLPRNAAQDCPYDFWERTYFETSRGRNRRMDSGVKGAHAHRYRHTLATRLVDQGATFEQVGYILGNSPAVVQKHGKWAKVRQDNIDRLMFGHFGTGPATFQVTK